MVRKLCEGTTSDTELVIDIERKDTIGAVKTASYLYLHLETDNDGRLEKKT